MLAEALGEIALVFKTDGSGDVQEREIALKQEPARLFDPLLRQIIRKADLQLTLKDGRKIGGIQADMRRNVF